MRSGTEVKSLSIQVSRAFGQGRDAPNGCNKLTAIIVCALWDDFIVVVGMRNYVSSKVFSGSLYNWLSKTEMNAYLPDALSLESYSDVCVCRLIVISVPTSNRLESTFQIVCIICVSSV